MGSENDPTKVRRAKRSRSDRDEPCLEIVAGRRKGAMHWIGPNGAVIGRTSEQDIKIDDDGVSRRHAKVTVSPDKILNLVDLESTNGTFLNGAPIDVAVLRPGDRIQLGPDVTLRFDYLDPEQHAEPVVATELSAREMEVATSASTGLTNAQIAKKLQISHHTVMSHLSNIYAKTGTKSRTELARLVAAGGVQGPVR